MSDLKTVEQYELDLCQFITDLRVSKKISILDLLPIFKNTKSENFNSSDPTKLVRLHLDIPSDWPFKVFQVPIENGAQIVRLNKLNQMAHVIVFKNNLIGQDWEGKTIQFNKNGISTFQGMGENRTNQTRNEDFNDWLARRLLVLLEPVGETPTRVCKIENNHIQVELDQNNWLKSTLLKSNFKENNQFEYHYTTEDELVSKMQELLKLRVAFVAGFENSPADILEVYLKKGLLSGPYVKSNPMFKRLFR